MLTRALASSLTIACLAPGCSGSQEAPRVTLAVVVDGRGIQEATTDLGWRVQLASCRTVIRDVEFTTAGEFHDGGTTALLVREGLGSSALAWLSGAIVANARAHPGHAAGGDIIGELPGRFVVDWCADAGQSLGDATLTVGDYNGANFFFGLAGENDGIEPEDPLFGQTTEFVGTAVKDAQTVAFTAVVAQDEGREIVGAPFELDVTTTSANTLGLQLLPTDPFEGDTVFDGVDFAALDEDGDGAVALELDETTLNLLRRALQDHDYYLVDPDAGG
ncbi:MAG: hypothetical protein H6713_28050 [Myxococcales bacterium]|nr:hypothetical protein [Myxococcales bacterium]